MSFFDSPADPILLVCVKSLILVLSTCFALFTLTLNWLFVEIPTKDLSFVGKSTKKRGNHPRIESIRLVLTFPTKIRF